jgi:hypothetical protein
MKKKIKILSVSLVMTLIGTNAFASFTDGWLTIAGESKALTGLVLTAVGGAAMEGIVDPVTLEKVEAKAKWLFDATDSVYNGILFAKQIEDNIEQTKMMVQNIKNLKITNFREAVGAINKTAYYAQRTEDMWKNTPLEFGGGQFTLSDFAHPGKILDKGKETYIDNFFKKDLNEKEKYDLYTKHFGYTPQAYYYGKLWGERLGKGEKELAVANDADNKEKEDINKKIQDALSIINNPDAGENEIMAASTLIEAALLNEVQKGNITQRTLFALQEARIQWARHVVYQINKLLEITSPDNSDDTENPNPNEEFDANIGKFNKKPSQE